MPERLIICTKPWQGLLMYSPYTGTVQITREDIRCVNSEGPPNIPTETGRKQYSSTVHPETPMFCKPLRRKAQREPRDSQRPEVFRTSRVKHLWNWSGDSAPRTVHSPKTVPTILPQGPCTHPSCYLQGCPTNISTPFQWANGTQGKGSLRWFLQQSEQSDQNIRFELRFQPWHLVPANLF